MLHTVVHIRGWNFPYFQIPQYLNSMESSILIIIHITHILLNLSWICKILTPATFYASYVVQNMNFDTKNQKHISRINIMHQLQSIDQSISQLSWAQLIHNPSPKCPIPVHPHLIKHCVPSHSCTVTLNCKGPPIHISHEQWKGPTSEIGISHVTSIYCDAPASQYTKNISGKSSLYIITPQSACTVMCIKFVFLFVFCCKISY